MDQIGRYKILGEIGRGAMGVVYRAQDPAIGRVVAIKTIRLAEFTDSAERAKLRERLVREAQSAGILSHPGIVTIFDVAEEDDIHYISMEYVDGPTLERVMATDPPDSALVLSVLTQTAAALDYAHKRGIVHRDIKPANVMLHEGAMAKITDFGVARIQSHQMTQLGSMVGTPNYMSPEQIQGKPVDGKSDQFSLAVIAYELFTGEKPFTADSIPALAFKIVQEDPLPVHRLNHTLDWPVDTVLKRALSKDPADRYPTCSDFAFAIENACRAAKDWKPVRTGAVLSMPTLAGKAVANASAVPLPARQDRLAPEATSSRHMELEEPEDSPPRALRIARNLALVAVVLAAIVLGALQFFDTDDAPEGDLVAQAGNDAQKPNPAAAQEVQDLTAGQAESPGASPNNSAPSPTPDSPPAPSPGSGDIPARRTTERSKPAPAAATRLVTDPPGATLVVDGQPEFTCQSPCSFDLPPGRHTLAATRDGYRRTLKIFETPNEPEIFINLDRTSGTLVVRSEPRGATIIVDGQTWKDKTPTLLTLPTGPHSIEVVDGSRRETHEVVIRESVITNLAVNLQDR